MNQNFQDEVDRAMQAHMDSLLRTQSKAWPSQDNGECVPQRLYGNGTGRSDPQNRRLEFFFREDGSYLPVTEASTKGYKGHGLMGHSSPALVGTGPTLAVRFEWPGYQSKDYQLRTIDWCEPPRNILLYKLAIEVAKLVHKLVEEMQEKQIDPNHARWRVGNGGIRVEDLCIGALEQVSASSWQVRLFYKRSH